MGIFSSLADNTFLLSGVYVGFIIPGFDFDSNGVAFGGLGPDSFVHANRSQTAFLALRSASLLRRFLAVSASASHFHLTGPLRYVLTVPITGPTCFLPVVLRYVPSRADKNIMLQKGIEFQMHVLCAFEGRRAEVCRPTAQ